MPSGEANIHDPCHTGSRIRGYVMGRRFVGTEEHVAVGCPCHVQSTRTPGTHVSIPEQGRR